MRGLGTSEHTPQTGGYDAERAILEQHLQRLDAVTLKHHLNGRVRALDGPAHEIVRLHLGTTRATPPASTSRAIVSEHPFHMAVAADRFGKRLELGKVCVLGLGFGMGPDKFIATALLMGGLVLTEDFARSTVRSWREANDKIVQFWYDLDDAFRKAINAAPGTSIQVGRVWIERGKDAIGIKLPSGRRLIYRNPRLEIDPDNKRDGTSIVYDGVQQYSKQWGPVRTYGGKLAENITQAVARDVMAHAMLLLAGMQVDLRLTVHDEIIAIAEARKAPATLALMLEVMRTAPPWAHGLPVGAEGWHGKRYRK